MMTLITILIGLLGYGEPEYFQDWTEPELQTEIVAVEQHIADGGLGGDYDI